MKPRNELKIYTLRHFLFYMGITWVAAAVIWAASEVFDWSYGLSVGVLIVAGLIVPTVALRESLFAPAQKPGRRQHSRHA
jgi:hypothetical protein